VEAKLFGYFGNGHGVREILLIGKNKEHGILEFGFCQEFLELKSSFVHSVPVVAEKLLTTPHIRSYLSTTNIIPSVPL
jgi:hypothetical protein